MNEIGIIGLGRFGKVLVNILQKGFSIYGYDIGNIGYVPGVTVCELEKVLKQKVIFIAVPIRSFKSLIQLIAPKLRSDTTLIDVCSVKTYPVQVMKENLNKNIGIIATHPMFGPDSFQTNNKLKMMMNKVNDPNNQFDVWKEFFENQRITFSNNPSFVKIEDKIYHMMQNVVYVNEKFYAPLNSFIRLYTQFASKDFLVNYNNKTISIKNTQNITFNKFLW